MAAATLSYVLGDNETTTAAAPDELYSGAIRRRDFQFLASQSTTPNRIGADRLVAQRSDADHARHPDWYHGAGAIMAIVPGGIGRPVVGAAWSGGDSSLGPT